MSKAYRLPINAKSLVESVMANICGSHDSLHLSFVEVSSHRMMIGKAFSVPKCVRLARTSHRSHQVLGKMRRALAGPRVDDLSKIWGEELLNLKRESNSDFEKQSTSGKVSNKAPAMDEIDPIHTKMMEFEPLLESSGAISADMR